MAVYQNKNQKSSFKTVKKRLSGSQKIIITIIIFLFILIPFTILFAFLNKPENLIKSKISALASDYYENYLYEKFANHNKDGSAPDALQDVEEHGLATTFLSQLLFYDKKIDQATIKYLTTHCDQNKTAVRFYPESPYSKTSYRAEYTYFCDF